MAVEKRYFVWNDVFVGCGVMGVDSADPFLFVFGLTIHQIWLHVPNLWVEFGWLSCAKPFAACLVAMARPLWVSVSLSVSVSHSLESVSLSVCLCLSLSWVCISPCLCLWLSWVCIYSCLCLSLSLTLLSLSVSPCLLPVCLALSKVSPSLPVSVCLSLPPSPLSLVSPSLPNK